MNADQRRVYDQWVTEGRPGNKHPASLLELLRREWASRHPGITEEEYGDVFEDYDPPRESLEKVQRIVDRCGELENALRVADASWAKQLLELQKRYDERTSEWHAAWAKQLLELQKRCDVGRRLQTRVEQLLVEREDMRRQIEAQCPICLGRREGR